MKAWYNENGNWCIEFENEEGESSRLISLVSAGVSTWREKREECPKAYIPANLFNNMLGEIFVRQNYTQEHPTVDDPYHFTSKEFLEHYIRPNQKYPVSTFNESELEIMRTNDIEDLL